MGTRGHHRLHDRSRFGHHQLCPQWAVPRPGLRQHKAIGVLPCSITLLWCGQPLQFPAAHAPTQDSKVAIWSPDVSRHVSCCSLKHTSCIFWGCQRREAHVAMPAGEKCEFNFGARPFAHPVAGCTPLQQPPPDAKAAAWLLGAFKRLITSAISCGWGLSRDTAWVCSSPSDPWLKSLQS